MSETTTAPSSAAPTPAPASSVTAKLKTDEIVLGPGGPGGMGSFFAAFAAGAGGGGIGSTKSPAAGKDSEEAVSLRPQTGFMKKPFASGSDAGQGDKQSPASGGAGGKNAKGAAGGTGGAKDQKKKYVYTASYLRKFQSAGAHPPEDMAWYLNEVKPIAQDQSALPIGQFQQRKTQGGQSRGQERGQRGNAQAQQAPVQSQPQEETLPHRQSANPWLPRFQSIFSSSDPQQQYRQKAVSAVIGVLNKLTLEHFDSLSTFLVKQLKEANGSDLKEEIIQLVFDKAISEPNFSTMYASLCQKLNEYCPKWKKGDQEETFRNVLLSLCQKQFEKSIQRDSNEDDEEQKREEREWKEKRRQEKNAGDDDATIDEDWEELRIAKIKKRNLGNVRFVGELYKKKLLNMQIIHDCISLILRKPQPYDEDIEILCNLLNTVGKAIDNTKSEALVNKYFEKMTKLAQNKQYPARIRFMLLDTIELRANKWVPRKEQNAPQKIADIHAKAYEEDLMSAALGQAFYAQQQAGLSAPASASSSSRTTTQPTTRAGGSATATTQKKASKEKETKHVSVKAPPKGGNVSGGSSDSILETELNAIIEEYVNSAEIEEALLCLKQLPNPNWPSWFVFCATNLYVEKKERDRQAIAGLFEAVLKENLLPSDELSKGFGKVFVTLEDLEIDVPHAVERVGELVARCARGKWLSSGAIQKELEPLPSKIKSKLQTAVEGR